MTVEQDINLFRRFNSTWAKLCSAQVCKTLLLPKKFFFHHNTWSCIPKVHTVQEILQTDCYFSYPIFSKFNTVRLQQPGYFILHVQKSVIKARTSWFVQTFK